MPLQLKVFPQFIICTFLFIGLLSSYGCQEQTTIEALDIQTNTAPLLKSLSHDDVLERRMQWAAYLSARVLCIDDDARTEIVELLQLEETTVLSLDQLLVNRDYAPRFRELFISEAVASIYHIDGFGQPSHNQVIPPSSRQSNLVDGSDYINFLTQDHCMELFFINGLKESPRHRYYSTAHPLTDATSNYGYEFSCQALEDGRVPDVSRTLIIVDPTLVLSGDEIIVCRPRRVPRDPDCDYAEFEKIDFTLFLQE